MSTNIRYSESFKMKVIQELSEGKFASIAEARELYGIHGRSTIQSWMRKYQRTDLLPRRIIVQSENDVDEIKRLKERIKQLEAVIVDQSVDSMIDKAFLEIWCEEAGMTDVEEVKKKLRSRAPEKFKNLPKKNSKKSP